MCAGPVKNVIDDISGKTAAEKAAKKAQKKADEEAKRKQDELDRLAAEREAAAVAQQQQLEDMQRQQDERVAQQQAQKAELERQHTLRMDKLEKEGTAATATARSLQVLAMKKQTKAPTATQTKAVKGTRGAKTTNVGLRIGSGSRGTGSGANLSV
tara:strand:- start:130 stop:597 length:468 start_codon:yes stop_codon:yes gene_type:complete